MVSLEAFQQVSIHAGDIIRVDKGGMHTGLFPDERCGLFTERVERAQTDDSDLCALFLDLVGVQSAEVLGDSLAVGNERAARHTDNDRMLVLLDAPVEHRQIFLLGGRCEVNEVGDVRQHGDVVQAEVGHIVHAVNRAPSNDDGRRIAVDAQILRDLVVGALNECAVHAVDRLSAVRRNAGGQRDCVLLGDADIDELLPGLFTHFLGKTEHSRRAGGDHAHGRVSLHLLQHKVERDALEALAACIHQRFAGFRMERAAVVPFLLVLLGRRIALAFLGDDVDNDRLFGVLDGLERLNERSNIVAVGHKAVIQTHRTEQVARGLAVRFAQQAQILIQAAVVLGDGHIIVVDKDDEVAVQLGRIVERLERFAAAERTVADDGYHIAVLALEVAALRQTARKAHRGGGVADDEVVVLALVRIAVTGNVVVVLLVQECILTAGQHLVRIGLVGNVEHELVFRGLKNAVQRNGGLHHAEVRAEMAAVTAQLGQQCLAHLVCKDVQLLDVQLFHISRAVDVLDIHSFPPEFFSKATLSLGVCSKSSAFAKKYAKNKSTFHKVLLRAHRAAENTSPPTVQ